MQKKKWMKWLVTLCIGAAATLFSACNFTLNTSQSNEVSPLEQMYQQYVVFSQMRGGTPLAYEEWLSAIMKYPSANETDDFSKEDIEDAYIDENGHLILKIEGQDPLDLGVIDVRENTGNDNSSNDSSSNNSSSDEEDEEENVTPTPTPSTNAVTSLDFTKATNVKTVADQGYYLGGCPTVGKPKVLVIPVEFSDITASSKGYQISKIKTAFTGGAGTTDYHSVHDYYYTSSYGKLDLDITVLDSWFRPSQNSSYYKRQTMEYYDEDIFIGDQMIMDEALQSLSKTMDLSKFDSDNNDMIDAVVLITTLEIDSDSDFNWAYRYWNLYTDSEGYYYEYDGVSANDYLWASYQFMLEEGDGYNNNALNTYTYIHEFGHVLGADDYYDTSYSGSSPLGDHDIMDSELGDHNPYTKFNYGWLTTSRLVVAENSVTLTLEDFSKNGDTIIIANNWDDKLGAYQEYFVLIYYTNNGLNAGDGGYFDTNGVLVYHVDAKLYTETIDGETYYDVYNNNTDPSDESGYGTEDNLIELVRATNGNYCYQVGAQISSSTKDNKGNRIAYTFKVDALTGDTATITFTKNN